jgi:hypothetical protein
MGALVLAREREEREDEEEDRERIAAATKGWEGSGCVLSLVAPDTAAAPPVVMDDGKRV